MDKEHRKERIAEYKQKEITGGIYRIYNRETGRSLIKGDINLQAVQNRFAFSQKTNSGFTINMQPDWNQYGPAAFAFEIIQEVKICNEESPKAFRDRLKRIEAQWKEKYDPLQLY